MIVRERISGDVDEIMKAPAVVSGVDHLCMCASLA